ncbi:hypothetical protein SADO_06317 [Salinisphaera dokdonensis CL-ES53]|uniref:Zorya protein ZorC EH domain-containing protein n=1 Tax=Salinisphaera dokdonensis CL-ES53 TaxID=1304272 RepID=A0ABV2AYY5_9GAMM
MPKQPTQYDLLETYAALSNAKESRSRMDDLPRRHMRRGPWVLFRSMKETQEPLAHDGHLLTSYYAALSSHGSDRTIGTLAHVYLRDYPTQAFARQTTQSFLAQELRQRDSPRIIRFRQRCEHYSLLEQEGAKRFASLLNSVNDCGALLSDAGLEGELAEQGFIVDAAEQWLPVISRQLEDRDNDSSLGGDLVQRSLQFYQARDGDKSLRFPDLRIELANALLLPFRQITPSASIREPIQRFLMDILGDPRLARGQWHGVDPEAREVLLRWLVNTTLKDFFRIVSLASKRDANADRMWPYRDAFWSAYLNKKVIDNAWVVLGSEIRQSAQSALSQLDKSAYGALSSGSGSQPSHAVLILQIGELIITEWSHSGKYRAWHVDDTQGPKFYRPRYRRDQLIQNPLFEGSHHHAEGGSWQRALAREIHNRTGIQVTEKEFMPRG